MSGAPSGIGYGEAQVYNTNGSLNAYNRIIQTQQIERQREQKVLADQLKTLKTDGLRDADRKDYYDKYDGWRTTASIARAEKDPRKKYELQAEADKKYSELNDLVYRSKEANKNDTDFAASLLDDRMRHQFKDSAVDDFHKNFGKAISDPTYISDKSTLARQVDEEKINKAISQLNDGLLKGEREQYNETPHTQGNVAGVKVERVQVVSPEKQETAYRAFYQANNDFKKYIDDKFPETDPAVALKQYAQIKRAEGGLVHYGQSDFKKNDDSWAKIMYREGRADARHNSSSGQVGASVPITIPYGEKGKEHVSFDQYIPISLSKKNFAGADYIDLKTGKVGGKLKSSNDYEIVGVGNAPVLSKDAKDDKGNIIKAGSIAQPNYASKNPDGITRKPIIHVQQPVPGGGGLSRDYFIPYDRLPENVKNSKQVREALAGFNPAKQPSQPVSKQNAQKTVSHTTTPSNNNHPKKTIKGF